MPGKRGIADLPEPLAGAQPREFASTQDALRWFDEENAASRFLFSWSAERQIDLHTWRLGWSLLIYQQWRSRTVEAWDTMQLSMQAAQRLGNPQITANVQVGLAFVESALDRSADSHRSLCKARDLELASGEDPPAVLARFHSRAGSMLESRQEYLVALPEHRAGLRLAVTTGNEAMLRLQLIRIAAAHAKLGHYRQAVSCGEAALRRMEKQRTESSGGIVGLGRVLDILGYAYHRIGLHSEADAWYNLPRDLRAPRAREHRVARGGAGPPGRDPARLGRPGGRRRGLGRVAGQVQGVGQSGRVEPAYPPRRAAALTGRAAQIAPVRIAKATACARLLEFGKPSTPWMTFLTVRSE